MTASSSARDRTLPFAPSLGAFGDFLVVARDSSAVRERMTAWGFARYATPQAVLYLLGLPAFDGRPLLSGMIRANQLEIGPKALSTVPDPIVGQAAVIESNDQEVTIRSDFLGLLPLFADDLGVSNRLHILAEIRKARNLYSVDVASASSSFFSENAFSWQLGVYRTPVGGVRLLGAGARVVFFGGAFSVSTQHEPVEALSPSEYHTLIDKGAEEVTANVAAALDTGRIVECAITGGRDSRVNLAALVALGRAHEVSFVTSPRGRDVEIATGLVKIFGGNYLRPPRPVGFRTITLEEQLDRRRSLYYGLYHHAKWALFRQVTAVYDERRIQLVGGCGECYRPFYQKNCFRPEVTSLEYSPDVLRTLLGTHGYWRRIFPESHLEAIYPAYEETFLDLRGETVSDKLDSLYLEFRNRFHFGMTMTAANSVDMWNPMASPSLLRASRGLPVEVRASGRVLFDVTRALCEKLAYLPYENERPDFSQVPYHRPSRFDHETLTLEPAPELIPIPQPSGVARPAFRQKDPITLMRASISPNLDAVSNGPLARLVTPEMRSRMEWLEAGKASAPTMEAAFSRWDALANVF